MIFSLLFLLTGFLHPVHISVTEINYSEKDKALQITSRIFIDDLELSIQKDLKQDDLDILNPGNVSLPDGQKKTTDQLISAYLLKHLKVKVDGKSQTLKYLGSEVENLAIICYLEIPNIKKLKTVETTNDVIMEMHSDQSNLVHVMYKEKVKSMRLVKEKPSDVVMF